MANTRVDNIHLLMVEDNPGDSELIQRTLIEVGFLSENLESAASLSRALILLDEQPFDAILLDLSLPDSRGYETFATISDHSSDSPIVILTGNDDDEIARELVRAGGQDYLIKSEFTPAVLSRAIKYAISRQHALRKLKERANEVQEGERLFRSIAVENADAILVVNKDGRICFANPAAEVLFDRQPDEMIGELFDHPIGDRWIVEITIPRPLGSSVCAEMRTNTIQWEGADCYLATLQDITARKLTEDTLRARESLLGELVNSAQDAVIVIDDSGLITTFNGAAERMFGRKAAEMIGGSLEPLMPADYRGRHKEYLEQYFRTGAPDKAIGKLVEFSGERSNGEIFPLEISLAAGENRGKKFVIAVAREISERKQAESILKDANRRLRELDQMKSDFLSTASHELRTPLTIISEFAAILRDGIVGMLSDEQLECVSSILNNTDRLGTLINDILDLQKMESGRLRVKRDRSDLTVILKQCVHDFRPQFDAKAQSITLRVPEDLPPALCDAAKITHVLINLIGNAHKFLPANGVVEVSACCQGQEIVVSVTDNGPGIPAEFRERIFDQFTQVDRLDGPGRKGTGLGLTIAKNIVELHEGIIGVDSILGEGSSFHFTVPIYTDLKAAKALIGDRLSVSKTTNRELSLALLRFEDTTNGDGNDTERVTGRVMSTAEQVIRDCLRREDDELRRIDSESMIVILCEADKAGIEAFMRRVLRSVMKDLDPGLAISYGTTAINRGDDGRNWFEETLQQVRPIDQQTFGRHILLVDDDEALVHLVVQALTNSEINVTVESTTDSYDACIRLKKAEPDLVILDVGLPNHDGREVLRLIRNSPHSVTTSVLVISENEGHDEEIEQMLADGADDYLLKPFSSEQLLAKVVAMLRHTNGQSEAESQVGKENHALT